MLIYPQPHIAIHLFLNYYDATSGTTGANNIIQLPLAFVRSGYVDLSNGRVHLTGYEGDVWSRASRSSTNARYLYFDSTLVNPSDGNNRYYGRPLRWLWPKNPTIPRCTGSNQYHLCYQ